MDHQQVHHDFNTIRSITFPGSHPFAAHTYTVTLATSHPQVQDVKAHVYGAHAAGPIGTLSATLFTARPSPHFHALSHALTPHLCHLLRLLTDHTGRVTQAHHPSLTPAASSGGLLCLHHVAVSPSHSGMRLGLSLIHSTLHHLHPLWSLTLTSLPHHAHRPPLKLRRHFARLGFLQLGRSAARASCFFLTDEMFALNAAFNPIPNALADGLKIAVPERPALGDLDRHVNHILDRDYGPPPGGDTNPATCHLPASEMDEVEALLLLGATVDRSRALHIAARRGYQAHFLNKLVLYGGNVNAADEDGCTPLHMAATGTLDSVPHLLELGADKNLRNVDNETPFDLIVYKILAQQAYFRSSLSQACRTVRGLSSLRNAATVLMPEHLRSQLIDGCMSQRMRKMLLVTAETAQRALFMHSRWHVLSGVAPSSHADVPLREFVKTSEDVAATQMNALWMEAEFVSGWRDVFVVVAHELQNGRAPTAGAVRDVLATRGSAAVFLYHGGRVEHAFDAVFNVTEEAFVDGCSQLWDYEEYRSEIEILPPSQADEWFELVRARSFLDGTEVPYVVPFEPSVQNSEVEDST